jgi:adenylate cyclase
VLAFSLYPSHFIVISLLGSATGMALHYMVAIALVALFFGTEGVALSALLAALATSFIIAIELLLPPNAGRVSDSMLLANFLIGVPAVCAVLYWVVYSMMRQTERAEATAERERQRSESLLVHILPPKIAERLKANDRIADRYDAASVLFADMAGFTARASDTEPDALVGFLDVFGRIDALVERHGLEKIKTTGDAYMVVSGVPEPRADHAEALAALALDMRDALAGLVDPKGRPVPIRIGIASGPVVAGVVGRAKFFYDVWGDAVNTAARMEQTAEPGTIQVAPEMRELLTDRFELQERGLVEVRGKGEMRTWLLVGRKH